MSVTVNARVRAKRDTTANWNAARGMVPLEGEVIIYTDYKTIQKEIDGELKNVFVPGIKIGDGRAYVQDLPFIDEELRDKLIEHIENQEIHASLGEKVFWNNKLNVDDNMELIEGALVFNRN